MADIKSPEKRSQNMAAIKGKDTSIEIAVRKYLFSKGYRFRKNDKRYPHARTFFINCEDVERIDDFYLFIVIGKRR